MTIYAPARKSQTRGSSNGAAKLSVARVFGNEQKLRSAGILSLQLGNARFLASSQALPIAAGPQCWRSIPSVLLGIKLRRYKD
jgi:hypothetical protein